MRTVRTRHKKITVNVDWFLTKAKYMQKIGPTEVRVRIKLFSFKDSLTRVNMLQHASVSL